MATAIAIPFVNVSWWKKYYRRKPVKHKLFRFSSEGDTAVAEWEVGDVKAEDFARDCWNEFKAKGCDLHLVTPEGAVGVTTFDPRVGDHLVTKRVVGG